MLYNYFENICNKTFSNKKYIGLLLLIGLGLRLAYFYSDGHNSDFDFFENWAERIYQYGFQNIYNIRVDRFECDYPPLYLYLLGFLGHVFHIFNWEISSHAFDSVLKAFTLLFETIVLIQIFKITRNKMAIFALLLSPVILINAYGWGQIDLIFGLLILYAILQLFENKLNASAILLAMALNFKSLTLLFLPIFLILLINHPSKIKIKLESLIVFLLAFLIPNLPFILWAPDPLQSLAPHFTASGRYDSISVNAYNFWWAIYGHIKVITKSLPEASPEIFGNISRKTFALGIFAIINTILLLRIWIKKPNLPESLKLLAFFSFSYFMFLPEMHERYFFMFFIFSPFLLSEDKREWNFYLILSCIHSFNLLWAWGEQKFFHQIWLFEIGIGLSWLSVILYFAYTFKLLFPKKMNLLSN